MGVHGLTSYVDGNRQFFTEVKLKNTNIVIDGCSLYFRLYFTSGLDQIRGGDYDAFSIVVRQFFTALASCDIRPYVVFDGGMDHTDKKFKTLHDRAQSKIREAHSFSRGSHGSVLPLLSREVFRQILRELNVPLVQCISEADFEIASLAHNLDCPVLSNDSDFYIFDLRAGYLPLAYFEWDNVCGKASERYITARRFTVNRFCSHFNHMNKQLLPLFAVITGNDYTPANITDKFFSRVELQRVARGRGSHSNPRIEGLLLWLSTFTSPVDALEEVLEILGGKQKGNLRAQLTRFVKDYQLPSTSSLIHFFTSNQPRPHDLLELPAALAYQPDWLLKSLIAGRLPSLVLDVLVLKRALLMAQVENSNLPSSHEASLGIRKVLYGLVLHNQSMHGHGQRGRGRGGMGSRGPCFVEEYDRFELNLKKSPVEVQLPNSQPQLNLQTLDKVAKPLRLTVLLGTLGVMEHVLQPLPLHLHLPACVTYFWVHSCKPKPSPSLIQSLLLGLVYGEMCRRKTSPGDPLCNCAPTAFVCQRLDQLRINSSQRRRLDLGVAHALCQWQSCMWAGIYLNQLLCFPLPEPHCAWLFSGTLLHGVEAVLRGGHQAQQLLAESPAAGQLYSILFGIIIGFPVQHHHTSQSAPFPTGNRGKRGQGKRQRGRGRASRYGGVSSASNLTNRFGMLSCEYDSDED